MSDHRDPAIRRALDDVDVPEYEPGFWDRLDARLEAEGRGSSQPGAVPSSEGPDPLVHELAAPTVVTLAPRSREPRRRSLLLLAAAAAAVVALAAAVQLRPGEDELHTASPPGATATDGAPDTQVAPPAAAEDVAVAWLEAIGAGDVSAVLERTGPRTVAYYDALGGHMPGVVTEWGEGYGGWADVADRSVVLIPLGDVAGTRVAVALVSGTWRGEGDDGYRSEALPMVQASDGSWSVEPAAFDPARDGRLEITSPPQTEAGLGGIGPDGVIEVVSAGLGSYFFAVDGGDVVQVAAGAEGSLVRFDPQGALGNGTHQLLVAQVDERNITAQALTFTVEG